MRAVLDTNVLVSGLLWHGPSNALLGHARAATIELVTSAALLDELADVITRRKFAAILERTTRTPEHILSELRVLAEVVIAPPLPKPVCRDPDDDAVLACALAGQADLIVSGDDDLLVLKEFQGIRIVKPAEAIRLLGEA